MIKIDEFSEELAKQVVDRIFKDNPYTKSIYIASDRSYMQWVQMIVEQINLHEATVLTSNLASYRQLLITTAMKARRAVHHNAIERAKIQLCDLVLIMDWDSFCSYKDSMKRAVRDAHDFRKGIEYINRIVYQIQEEEKGNGSTSTQN